ncbi:Pisatin demethylase [Pyrenophora teres f. teres]|uniref:Cytochrome P450 monooxygenase ABA1 n=1 Tax=Pyrenophora teres f. teres TaxID=97479 RepID=A0A6S6WGV7_9PLEO|nr:Pisatin demethylase [Pyrenophora teres f. teres]
MDTASLLDHVPRRLYVLVFVAVAVVAIGRIRLCLRLRHFRGPATSGFSWLWHSKAVISGQSPRYYGQVCEKYGPIARIAPNHLITSDPEFWTQINAVRSPYRRSTWYYHAARFEPGKDNVFTECDNDRHDARRKKMTSGYAGKENPDLEPSIDVHVKELVELVRKYASSTASTKPSRPMDLAEKIPFFTLDVISHVGLGEAFGDLKADKDLRNYVQSSEEGLKIGNTAFALGISWLKNMPVIGPAISPSENDATGFGNMMAQARKIVESRSLKPTEGKSDMFASFVRHGVSGDDLFQEVFEQILAGSDTTSAAIRVILLHIMTHPRVYAKLQAEVVETVRGGLAPAPPDVISDAEVRRLPYLGAVIREAMRVHPPVANIFSRVTPDEGDVVTIDNKEYFIPGGTLIGYSAWAMHRNNPSLYGEDCAAFRPERWLFDTSDAEAKERLARMTKTNDLIFGYGRWLCLGRNIALLEIYKCVFELLRHFDLSLTYPLEPWKTFNSLGLWAIKDMWVDVTLRD